MSGHVFHHGHHDLHGITVVTRLTDGTVHVGRFDHEDQGKIHLLDVSTQAAASDHEIAAFLSRTAKFGVRVDQKHLSVPSGEVASVTPLQEAVGG